MSEIKNVGQTWMALNSFKCNYLTSPHFKGLKQVSDKRDIMEFGLNMYAYRSLLYDRLYSTQTV